MLNYSDLLAKADALFERADSAARVDAELNSVEMFVRDVTGAEYLHTFAANTKEQKDKFRRHVEQWKRYMKTAEGQKTYRNNYKGAPVSPMTIVMREYHDKSQNA